MVSQNCRQLVEQLEQRVHLSSAAEGVRITETVQGLRNPVSLVFTPDGRALVTEQAGRLRVIRDGILLNEAAFVSPNNQDGERGLLGVEVDPDFGEVSAGSGWIYIYRTVSEPTVHNQVIRFWLEGDVARPDSEEILLDLPTLPSATNHNGGSMHFGPDGFLYIATGDVSETATAPDLNSPFGKILRINPDGSIPESNPFFNQTTGINQAIWARGLRNPFTFGFSQNGRLFINDVGSSGERAREEINVGSAGADFGWPSTEGSTTAAGLTAPLYSYAKAGTEITGNAIAGAAFFEPDTSRLPARYTGTYLFGDYSEGWVNALDTTGSTPRVIPLVGGLTLGAVSDIDVAPDGSVWVLNYASGFVYRIDSATSSRPRITQQPQSRSASLGERITFSVAVSSSGQPTYQWRRNEVRISGATNASYTTPALTAGDDNARYSVLISNAFGRSNSAAAVVSVNTSNNAPRVSISSPSDAGNFSGNSIVSFSGGATDTEEGTLDPSRLTWTIIYQTDSVLRPFATRTGISSGTFTIPTRTPFAGTNVRYIITLRARDEQGAVRSTSVSLLPRISTITLQTVPRNGTVFFDGTPYQDGTRIDVVSGYQRDLSVPRIRTASGIPLNFVRWNIGGARSQTINAPIQSRTFTATFAQSTSSFAPASVAPASLATRPPRESDGLLV